MRLGVFGGTFDPPHIAHLILAMEAYEQLHLDRVLWVLTPNPPHKPDRRDITPLAIRLEMLNAAIAGNPAFAVSRADIDRPPPHYATGTMKALRIEFPSDTLVYLIGGDSLRDLPTWHEPQEFLAAVDELGVMRRPGARLNLAALETLLPSLHLKLRFVHAPLIEISGTVIRQRAAAGQDFRYYLLPSVYAQVVVHNLYQST